MDAILAATTVHQKRQVLGQMASGFGLHDAYNTTLDRIRQQDGSRSRLGMATLIWISRSERPLLWEELCHALGVDLGAGVFTINNIPSVRTVLGCTLGLVTVDENASTVRLLHLTLQEYLAASPVAFETPQSMMAEICLTYLNSPLVREPQPDVNKALAASPFLEYATRFWGTHAARDVTEQVKSRALQLLDGYENSVSATIFWRKKLHKWYFNGDIYGISGLHCIAYWGIAEIAIAMLEKKKWDVNGKDSRGDTPLMWAIRYGHYRVVELLLEQADIRPDVVIRDGRTLFSFAAESGNERAVKLLVECGNINPDSSDSNGRTPLSYAASRGCEGVVKLLLGCEDVSPNSLDINRRTPLSYAASIGAEYVVKLLLEREGVNPNSPDNEGRTPLSHAALSGNERVVRFLLERGGVNPNSPDNEGRTPLSYAILSRYTSVERLLRRAGANPHRSGSRGRRPLPYATSMERESVGKPLYRGRKL